MKANDLIFWKEVKGKKSHYIFKQEENYYIFTTKENDTRGNFFIISQSEVNTIKIQLSDDTVSHSFHPDNVYEKIKGMVLPNNAESSYLISRFRNICYILVAQNMLKIVKDGRSIFFSKTFEFTKQSKTSKNKNDKTSKIRELNNNDRIENEKPIEKNALHCPICKCKIKNKQKLEKHLQKVHENKETNSNENNISEEKEPIAQSDMLHCPICKCKIKNKQKLEKHLQKVHKTKETNSNANNISEGKENEKPQLNMLHCPICK